MSSYNDLKYRYRSKSKRKFLPWVLSLLVLTTSLGASWLVSTNLIRRESALLQSRQYERYLDEIFHTLRLEKRVHLIRLDLPGSMTAVSRRLSNTDHRRNVTLHSQGTIQVMAVSKNAKGFLDRMRVLYWDPSDLPQGSLQRASLPMPIEGLQRYVLVPTQMSQR